ncbi:flagellar basal body-associated FliL family protein [Salibaculum sp.]|uniref:flagellar basal body-associated FliL family protein n=1 Tax=Salibaculum sp. TaxID=2855480 RepID=UPI002B46C9B1|nr:flagellar basal body-associated FliL family protein [Salibaculum sp.]HKL68125.1 flagellar basal body-associated FliL family protein [Salibaculum sp.]
MTDETADRLAEEKAQPKKAPRWPLILGVVLAIGGGGGGFAAVQMGLLDGVPSIGGAEPKEETAKAEPLDPLAFVPLDTVIISLAPSAAAAHLRFNAQLEVAPDQVEEVETLRPRIMDVLNGYLRAVAVEELQDPAALARLRAQMLRRVQVVVGEGRVRDLLIMEFVLD